MSTTDILLVLVVVCLAYVAITLKVIGASVERMAGVSHYQQQSPFKPDIRALKAPFTKKAPSTSPEKSSLVDITDMSEDDALKALEDWGSN